MSVVESEGRQSVNALQSFQTSHKKRAIFNSNAIHFLNSFILTPE